MARMRSLKPEFWHDRKLARSCSRDARMLYMGLWNQADEHGRANGDEAVIKGQIFPFDDDVQIGPLLDELEAAGRVVLYEFDSDPYLFLPKLGKHQRLEPVKVPSRCPEPPLTPDPPRSEAMSARRTDKSARDADESEKICAKQVAGSREQVAGSREHVARAERGADKPAPTITQRSKRITDAYAEQVPLSNWPAVNGVVLKALKSERYADDEIGCALLRLAHDGRAVTVDVLRTELEGFGQRASPNKATERFNQGLAVVRKLEAQARGELA